MKLSIVIPAHNEEERLPPVLDAYARYFGERFGNEVEIIVVVNFSSDNTLGVTEAFAESHPIVRVINEPKKVGKGGAVLLGLKQAKGELVGFVDADGSTAPDAFYDLVEKIGDAGCIIASRWMKGSVVEPKQPLSRRIASRIFNGVVNLFFGFRVHDTQCGAKLFTRKTIDAVLPEIGITKWAFDVDMLYCVRRHGFKIVEIPTVWRDAAGSKIKVAKASAEMALAMVRLRLIYSPFKGIVGLYNRIDRPWKRYVWSRIQKDDLLRHSTMLFASTMVVHLCSVGFQMVVGRKLPKDEFALLSAFLATLMIIQRPLATLRGAVCHYGSLLDKEGRRGDIKRLLRKWLLLTSVPSLAAGFLAIVFSRPLAMFFNLDRPAPVIIAGLLLPALCWLPILSGAAQGLQLFSWVSSSTIIGAVVRLLLGGGFAALLYRACGWVMLGHGVSIYVTAAILLFALWLVLHGGEPGKEPLPSMRLYVLFSFIIQAAYAVLMTSDVVLVKHYVPSDSEFSFAATLGRMVAFLPGAIVMAMFP